MSNDTGVIPEGPSGETPITSVRLPRDLRAAVAEMAPDRSMGSVVREALEQWVDDARRGALAS